jgi:hypothetical protein
MASHRAALAGDRDVRRQVQAVGGVKAFLQHLDLAASIKSDKPTE